MQSIQPTIKRLNDAGIGAILDYAAESDVHSESGVAGADSLSADNYETIVRTCAPSLSVIKTETPSWKRKGHCFLIFICFLVASAFFGPCCRTRAQRKRCCGRAVAERRQLREQLPASARSTSLFARTVRLVRWRSGLSNPFLSSEGLPARANNLF